MQACVYGRLKEGGFPHGSSTESNSCDRWDGCALCYRRQCYRYVHIQSIFEGSVYYCYHGFRTSLNNYYGGRWMSGRPPPPGSCLLDLYSWSIYHAFMIRNGCVTTVVAVLTAQIDVIHSNAVMPSQQVKRLLLKITRFPLNAIEVPNRRLAHPPLTIATLAPYTPPIKCISGEFLLKLTPNGEKGHHTRHTT